MRVLLFVLLLAPSLSFAKCTAEDNTMFIEQVQPQLDQLLGATNAKVTLVSVDGDCAGIKADQRVVIEKPFPVQWFRKTRLRINKGNMYQWLIVEAKLQQKQYVYSCEINKNAVFDASCLEESRHEVTNISPKTLTWSSLVGSRARTSLGQGDTADLADWLAVDTFGKGQRVGIVLQENGIRVQLEGVLVADSRVGQDVDVLVNGQTQLLRGRLEHDGKVYLGH